MVDAVHEDFEFTYRVGHWGSTHSIPRFMAASDIEPLLCMKIQTATSIAYRKAEVEEKHYEDDQSVIYSAKSSVGPDEAKTVEFGWMWDGCFFPIAR